MKLKKTFKKQIFPSIVLFLGLVFFTACEKDFSVNSDSEPFPVVYGILDIADNVHYIKIYKSYLTEGSAYGDDMVKNIHKYSYIDSLDVYMIEYNAQGDSIRTILFDTTTSIPKDSGLFGYPMQILYKAEAILDIENTYKLVVFNPYTKDKIEAKAPIALTSPPTILESIIHTEFGIAEGKKILKFRTGKNTAKYFLQTRYFYTEDFNGTYHHPKPVIWRIGNVIDYSSIENIEKTFTILTGSSFFAVISFEVEDNPNVRIRHTDSIRYEVLAVATDLELYLRSIFPAVGINQERLNYSNMKAYNIETKEEKYVLGVFSSWTTASKYYTDLMSPGPRDSLFDGRYTGHLGFTDLY